MFLFSKVGRVVQGPLWACVLVFSSVPVALPAAFAQTQNTAPNILQYALENAWTRSPTARGLQSKQDESKAALNAANSWVAGSPTLGLSQRLDQSSGVADVGFRESEVSIAAPVWWLGQKSARQTLASHAAEELDAQTAQARLDLANQIREAYWQVALTQEDARELEDHLQHLMDIAKDVARRVQAGDLARSDGLLADQEVQHAKTQWTAAKAEHQRQVTHYRNLTGLEAPSAFYSELPQVQAADHPRLRLGKANLLKARAALDLALESRADTPSVGVSLRNERDNFSPNSRALGFHLQIPIGTDVQGLPLQATAKTHIAVAEAELKQYESAVANEVELAKMQLNLEREALGQATQRALLTAEYLTLIEKAFRLGERALNDLLRAQVLSHEANSAKTKQQLKVNLAISRLNHTFGVFP